MMNMDACKLVDEANAVEDTHHQKCRTKPRRVVKVSSAKVNQRKLSKGYKRASYIQEHNLSIQCHAIFIFLDPLLLGVLQVEYQNKKESPLETNPIQMQTFLVAICIYSAVLGIKIQNTQQSRSADGFKNQILSFVILVSGSVSSGALFSILLHGVLSWLVLIILGTMPIILCRHLIIESVCFLLGLVAKFDLKGKFSSVLSSIIFKAQCSNIDHTDARLEGV